MSGSGERRPNILVIMSDEHDPAVMGCSGHPLVQTPNLDRLAAAGTVFDNAYCNYPICVPSRMSFLTGNYCHRIGVWDLGSPLRADIPTFGHYFTAAGYESVLCGRTHLVGSDRLHGFGTRLFDDLDAWRGRQAPRRTSEARRGSNSHVTECGPGPGAWFDYDTTVADLSVRFLKSRAAHPSERPWLLYSGLMYPHFPLTCPPEYYRRYDPEAVTPADLRGETLESQHPAIRQLRYFFHNDEIVPEPVQRRALASYYGLVTLVDDLVGSMLAVIDNSPLRENTVVIYLSDHGEMAGQHGIWQKQCFYEASVRVPMILRTPRGDAGQRDRHQRVAGRRAAHRARPRRHRQSTRPAGCEPRAHEAGRGRRRPGGVQRVSRPGHAGRRIHAQARPLEVQLLRGPPAATLRPTDGPRRVHRPGRRRALRPGAG